MFAKCKKSPMHVALGLGMIAIGIWLIMNDRFFIWPPEAVEVVNDDIWGFMFALVGVGHLIWVYDSGKSVKWNRVLLTLTGGLMGFLTVYQFLIWNATGHYMSWISNAIITAFVLILARRSDSGNA
ncbi:hypothetical protein [Lapidilactobacillus wuchangensis]|uniref:hypothetical protein n=1 Tax=Lapidilactobacillus wuchangensis TaxID=2486001 RepID=UPI00384ED640